MSCMNKILLYLLLFCNFWLLISCNKDKLKSPQAGFLIADTTLLKTTVNQGANSHKITDLWYYVNGQFKGVFPVGGVMPIVSTGNTEITLFAGIKNNGISATRIPYPLFKSITFNQNIEAGKTYTVTPEFEYNSSAFFYYCDDFTGVGSFFTSVGDSAVSNTKDFDVTKSFGGTGGSLFMSMSDAKPTARILQTTPYFLPSGGETIYLELNYKCNQPFSVGVIGGNFTSQPEERTAITVNRSHEWNKIYIQLTGVVSAQPVYSDYKVFIHAKKLTTTPEIYIDNVKLIYL